MAVARLMPFGAGPLGVPSLVLGEELVQNWRRFLEQANPELNENGENRNQLHQMLAHMHGNPMMHDPCSPRSGNVPTSFRTSNGGEWPNQTNHQVVL
jgi:hypothetical protein